MRIKVLIVAMLMLAALALPVTSWADTCPASSATHTNTGQSNVAVCYNVSGSTLTVTSLIIGGTTISGVKLFQFATLGPTITSVPPAGGQTGIDWTMSACSNNCKEDGFTPNFTSEATSNTGNPGDTGLPISFGLGAGTITDLAFHLGGIPVTGGGTCSLWVSLNSDDGGSAGNDPTGTSCGGGTTRTPEPGSMALLGTGLVGIAGVVRRRLSR